MTRPTRSLLIAALLLAGCSADADPNSLLARVRRDCAEGVADACSLFGSVQDLGTSVGPRLRLGRYSYDREVQQDVGALLQGMDRARASTRVRADDLPHNGKS
jgi:hypothetical protein